MDLYIVRHGIALDAATAGISDFDRPLTDEGIEKLKGIGKGLRLLEVRPEVILTSPLVRARQTAERLQEALQCGARIEETPSLSPASKRAELYRELQDRSKLAGILLVGHQPSLGEIAGEIAWGNADSGLDLKKGGACKLEISELRPLPSGRLLWLLTPAILRKLR
jgi:phosphohistidine phosphatase